ncbi:MAG: hypothetical protein GXO83_09235 [Chlorobi bacterium]|nr:hypothetical protein [Chlorobiota bacterium]
MKKHATLSFTHKNVTHDACLTDDSANDLLPVDYDASIDDVLDDVLGGLIIKPSGNLMTWFFNRLKLIMHPAKN